MKLKRVFVEVNHDGPIFTDSKHRYDYCVYDIQHRFKIDIPLVIPMYIDLDDFKKKQKG